MIIAPSPRIQVEFFLHKAHLVVWALVAVVCLSFCLAYFLIPEEKVLLSDHPLSKLASQARSLSSYEEIGKGALSLSPVRKSSLIPDLSKEILVLARNSRPDCQGKEASLLLGTRSSNTEKVVRNGQQIFLTYEKKSKEEPATYSFSEHKTSLWIKPVLLDKDEVFLEVGVVMPSKETEMFIEEKAQFLLQQTKNSFKAKEESSFLSSIKQAKWWGNDFLLMHYGGAEYHEMKEKQKIEIPFQTPSCCFVSQGDYLEWREGRWQVAVLNEASKSTPIAYIKSLSPRQMEFEVWDEKGFYPSIIRVNLQPQGKAESRPDLLPSSIRLRSSSQITCNLGKRRYILKEGDWMLKTPKGWRNLKKAKDIDDCIQHKVRGELFIFDGMEKEHGKLVLKGHWLDEMHTQIVPISIPIAGESNVPSSGKKSKASSLFKKMSCIPLLDFPLKGALTARKEA